jgi:hypothetical protein
LTVLSKEMTYKPKHALLAPSDRSSKMCLCVI